MQNDSPESPLAEYAFTLGAQKTVFHRVIFREKKMKELITTYHFAKYIFFIKILRNI